MQAILLSPRLYGGSDQQVHQLQHHLPEFAAATIASAETVLRHEFNLLGSGPFVPVDRDRVTLANGYAPIDWYLDPVSGERFPQRVPLREWNFQVMRPGLADIKLPWELARCQHWSVLAQAFRLTGRPAFASEIANETLDFMEANPVGLGINWTCTMDVALRALNWALAFEWIRRAESLTFDFWLTAYGHLYDHGAFVRHNLEDKYEVTSNHFLSNIVGLFYLGHVFRGLPEAREWLEFSRRVLEREMEVQVLSDGADFESSVPYHRLVTELFLGAARLAESGGTPMSEAYCKRLRKMVEFSLGTMRPDGLMPQIGDADDGRLHIFTGYGRWRPQDARHLLAPAAILLGDAKWLRYAGAEGAWEAAWWGFDPPLDEARSEPPPNENRLFPDAGLAVSRAGGDYLVVTNGIVGTKGFGNHKHNDQLGFEFHARGVPLLVDPGSYVYTSNPDARNLFRSTAYHNTLCIDGEEQNEVRPEWLFRLFETARAEHLGFDARDDYAEYRGRHVGYSRLTSAVIHARRLRHEPRAHSLIVEDTLEGQGRHRLVWHFHFAPGVVVEPGTDGHFRLLAGDHEFEIVSREGLSGQLIRAWYSPSYGVRLPCVALDITLDVTLRGRGDWAFCVAPVDGAGATQLLAAAATE